MVKLRFIIRDGSLVLRISEYKERYYKSVKQLLISNPNLRYWNSNKKRFNSRCSSYLENNKSLDSFKAIYSKLTIDYPELTARQITTFYKSSKKMIPGETSENFAFQKPYQSSVEEFLKVVVEREKQKQ